MNATQWLQKICESGTPTPAGSYHCKVVGRDFVKVLSEIDNPRYVFVQTNVRNTDNSVGLDSRNARELAADILARADQVDLSN